MIAFTSGSRHGLPNLWVISAGGKTPPRQLTTNGAHYPIWLPGSHTIIYGTGRTGEPKYMAVDATNTTTVEQPLSYIPPNAEAPVWSRDGGLFAYGMPDSAAHARNLCYGRTHGGGASELTKNFWVREWAWTPDNQTLAFVVGRAIGTSLWTVNLADKNVQFLCKGFCGSPVYSPDGKKLAIATPDMKSGFSIVIIDPATRKNKQLTVQTFDGNTLCWTPDSTRLVFAAGHKQEPSLWSIGANGEGLVRLTPKGLVSTRPALAPDGQRLAFQAFPDGAYAPELYTCDISGKNITRLTYSQPSCWAPIWSPDGKQLAYLSDAKHVDQLYLSTPSDGSSRLVTTLASTDGALIAWLPDGKRLLLSDGGKLLTCDTTRHTGSVTPVFKQSGPVQTPRLAGNEVIFTSWEGEQARIAAVKLDGAGLRALTNKPAEVKPNAEHPKAPAKDALPDKPRSDAGNAEIRVAGTTQLFIAQAGGVVKPGAAPSTAPHGTDQPEVGNPHAGLGNLGPIADVNPQGAPTPPILDQFPAVSNDRHTVAFIRQGQLWLVNADGTDERQLTQFETTNAGAHRLVAYPFWSPDGHTLLFLAIASDSGKMQLEIWLADMKPGSERRIYTEQVVSEYGMYYLASTNPPAFTPDARHIILTSIAANAPRIVSIDLDGNNVKLLVPTPAVFPVLDATGKRLAYVDCSGTTEQLRVLELSTGKQIRVPR